MQLWRDPLRWRMSTLHLTLPPVSVGQLTPLTVTPCLPPASTTVTWVLLPRPPITTISTTPNPAPSWVEEAPRPLSLCHAVQNFPLTSPLLASRWITPQALLPHALPPTAPWNALKSWATQRPPRWLTRGRSLLPRRLLIPRWYDAMRATITTMAPAGPLSRITLVSLSLLVPEMSANLISASPELLQKTTATTQQCTTRTTPTLTITPSSQPSVAPRRIMLDENPPTLTVSVLKKYIYMPHSHDLPSLSSFFSIIDSRSEILTGFEKLKVPLWIFFRLQTKVTICSHSVLITKMHLCIYDLQQMCWVYFFFMKHLKSCFLSVLISALLTSNLTKLKTFSLLSLTAHCCVVRHTHMKLLGEIVWNHWQECV